VLGAGAWGTALASALAVRHEVTLWARDAAQVEAIARARENRRYLPGIALPESLAVAADWPRRMHLLIAATPVAGVCHARGENAGMPAQWLIYIVVENLDEALARCEAAGGTTLHKRSMGSGGMAVIRDPAGAVCGLYQS